MEKNWLIRTKSNHILGPISKEKVLELFNNGSIKSDDEVCAGNGFWFFIREDDMVSRFLTGDEVQCFNPISEAKDVLTSNDSGRRESTKDDITMVGGLNLDALKKASVPAPAPAAKVQSADAVPPSIPHQTEVPSADAKKKGRAEIQVKPSDIQQPQKKVKKQNYLQYIGVVGFIILFLMIYFRKYIIRHLFNGEMALSTMILDQAHAQEEIPPKKKNYYLSP